MMSVTVNISSANAMANAEENEQYTVNLVFDMNITEIAGLEASFKISVRESLSNALDLHASMIFPEEVKGDPSVGRNLTLTLSMSSPDMTPYITKLYQQISNPISMLRQGQYTKKAVTAEVSKVCQLDPCQEAKRLMKERDMYDEEADVARKEFFRLHLQSEATRQAALDAEKAVALLMEEMKTMEGDLAELRKLAPAGSDQVQLAELNLNDFKRNLREHVESATKTAQLAKTLMEDVARARQEAQLKASATKDIVRQWTKACHQAIVACAQCRWEQELLRHTEGQFQYSCPNYCGFAGSFYDTIDHFGKCQHRATDEQMAREQKGLKPKDQS